MDRLIPTIIIALVVLGILTLMLLAWRRRVGRAQRVQLPEQLEPSGELRATLDDVFYVATTFREAPLERVAIRGLRYRGLARVEVFDEGITITVRGEPPCALARSVITDVSTQQLTIDKVVEPDGLVAVHWISELGELSSVFRVQQADARAELFAVPTANSSPHRDRTQEKS